MAGVVAMWLSVGVFVPAVVLVERLAEGAVSPTDILELGGLFVVSLLMGMSYLGAVTIPAGLVVGYLLGKRQSVSRE